MGSKLGSTFTWVGPEQGWVGRELISQGKGPQGWEGGQGVGWAVGRGQLESRLLPPFSFWSLLPGHCHLDGSLTPELSLFLPEAGALCREAGPSGAGEIREWGSWGGARRVPNLTALCGCEWRGHTDPLTWPFDLCPPFSALLSLWPFQPQSLALTLPHLLQERRALERKAAELEEELKVNDHGVLWAVGSACPVLPADPIPSHRPCPTSGLTTSDSRMRLQP